MNGGDDSGDGTRGDVDDDDRGLALVRTLAYYSRIYPQRMYWVR